MTLNEFYLKQEIKCLNSILEFEKGIEICTEEDEKLLFTINWLLNNKYLYKSIINKPKGLPGFILSSAMAYKNIVNFYQLFNAKNIDIINDEDLDSMSNLL